MRSACLGLARKTSEPKRERSYCGAEAAATISIPQQARAYINGQIDRERDQFCAHRKMSLTVVRSTGSSCCPGIYSCGPRAMAIGTPFLLFTGLSATLFLPSSLCTL